MSRRKARPSGGKWIKGVSADMPTYEAARRILKARLEGVQYWMPLAAEQSEDDVEYVHQLRVASRRAVEAVRVFADLLPAEISKTFRARLQQIRRAADEARDLDVLCERFLDRGVNNGDCGGSILSEIRARRRQAQLPIVAVYGIACNDQFDHQIDAVLKRVHLQRSKVASDRFHVQAKRALKPIARKFFEAAEQDLTDAEALHNLRVRGKKLRYRMELLAVAYPPKFRKKLYRRMVLVQDLLGRVNDHAAAVAMFDDWLKQSRDADHQLFFQGVLFAERKAYRDIQQTVLAGLTPRFLKELKGQFGRYC